MTSATYANTQPAPPSSATTFVDRALTAAGASWLITAIVGQLFFAVYVLGFYGHAAVQGRLADWTKVLSHGHVPGDFVGNAMIWLHLIFTVMIILGGALQLVPRIRRVAPAFHRVNGRVYLVAAVVLSITGIVMILTRGTVGNFWQQLGTSLNGVLIVIFAAMSWRHARARRIDVHRRWALRLFLAVSGVWFFRVGLMFWLVVHQAPVGFDPKTFTGPFLVFLSYAQYLIPLAVLELYFAAQREQTPGLRLLATTVLAAATLITAVGIGAAAMTMWLPRI